MEDLLFSVKVMILGFTTVLVTLFLLYLLILVFGRLLGPEKEYTTKTRMAPSIKPLGEDIPAEKVAAITAAVYEYLYSMYGTGNRFKITGIIREKGKAQTNSWAKAGKEDILNLNEELEMERREKHGKKIL